MKTLLIRTKRGDIVMECPDHLEDKQGWFPVTVTLQVTKVESKP